MKKGCVFKKINALVVMTIMYSTICIFALLVMNELVFKHEASYCMNIEPEPRALSWNLGW
jgi:hypothetical protein